MKLFLWIVTLLNFISLVLYDPYCFDMTRSKTQISKINFMFHFEYTSCFCWFWCTVGKMCALKIIYQWEKKQQQKTIKRKYDIVPSPNIFFIIHTGICFCLPVSEAPPSRTSDVVSRASRFVFVTFLPVTGREIILWILTRTLVPKWSLNLSSVISRTYRVNA